MRNCSSRSPAYDEPWSLIGRKHLSIFMSVTPRAPTRGTTTTMLSRPWLARSATGRCIKHPHCTKRGFPMAADVDAVIAALRTLLQEAETRTSASWWQATDVNRWIDQLPGAWRGRWRRLRLLGLSVKREDLITHVRTTLAYLDTNRDAIAAGRKLWPFRKAARKTSVSTNQMGGVLGKKIPPPKWLN